MSTDGIPANTSAAQSGGAGQSVQSTSGAGNAQASPAKPESTAPSNWLDKKPKAETEKPTKAEGAREVAERLLAEQTSQETPGAQPTTTEGRPDWLKEKYQNAEEQAKAYNELDKMHGKVSSEYSKVKDYFGAPEEGYQVPEVISAKLDEVSGGILTKFNEFSKENNFSEKLHGDLVNFIAQWEGQKLADAAQVLQNMENGMQRFDTIQDWLFANFDKEALSAVKHMPLNESSITFFENMRSKMSGQSNIPTQGSEPVDAGSGRTPEQLQRELKDNFSKFRSDDSFRQDFVDRLHDVEKRRLGKT